MPKITDFEPDALAELLASIGKADAKVFADVPVDVLGAAAKALQPKGGGGKKEKKGGDGGEKKDAGKKEKPPADPVKEREKLEKKVIKEGGKKGVEIEGASDMGACRCGLRLHPHHPHSPPKLPPPLQAGSTSSAPRSSRPTATSTCSRWR